MPDVRESQPIVESAEKAAAAGDYTSAEALLREAARLQEATLGPLHPDLASTFNNLAVVCEMAHKPVEAEQFYRRAYAIASTALEPEHPLVATSRDNLRDFCAARGLPLDGSSDASRHAPSPIGVANAPGRAPAGPADTPAGSFSGRSGEPRLAREPSRPAVLPAAAAAAAIPSRPSASARSQSLRGFVAALLAIAVVAAVAFWWSPMNRRTPAAPADAPGDAIPPSSAGSTRASAEPQPDPAAAVPGSEPAVVPAPRANAAANLAAAPAPAAPEVGAAAAVPAVIAPPSATAGAAGVRVLIAEVCRTLTTGSGRWQCDPAEPSAAAGRFSFYTRIASPRPITVRHRWYLGDSLRQDVGLRISANPSEGYRTFSRQTVSPGAWRVELRSLDGTVLQEARFVVQ